MLRTRVALDAITAHAGRLSESFLSLTASLRQATEDATANTLDHLVVQEAAAQAVQV